MPRLPVPRGLALTPPLTILLIALHPTVADAHTGIGPAAGLIHGLAHPLGGPDHLLVMVAVGLWAAQRGGRALWALPGTFVSAMVVGGALGMIGLPLPGVEGAIAASVLVFGAVVAMAASPPLSLAVAVVAVAATFHGYAHAAEMPAAATGVGYAFGFAFATALLHASGVLVAFGATRRHIAHAHARDEAQGDAGIRAQAGTEARVGSRSAWGNAAAWIRTACAGRLATDASLRGTGGPWVRAAGAAIVLGGFALLLA